MRTFRAPLFGNPSSSQFQFFGSQAFANGSSVTAFMTTGFPGLTSGRATFDGYRWRNGYLEAEAGDLGMTLRGAEGVGESFSEEFLPVTGLGAEWDGATSEWQVYAGRGYRSLSVSGAPNARPTLLMVGHRLDRGSHELGVGLMAMSGAPFIAGKPIDRDVVVTADIERTMTMWSRTFLQVLTNTRGAAGARGGWKMLRPRLTVEAAAYLYGENFPFLYPLIRPGEKGLQLMLSRALGEFSRFNGTLNVVTDQAFEHRSRVHGSLGYTQGFGSNRPFLYAYYSADGVTRDVLGETDRLVLADRYTLGMRQTTIGHSYDLRGDYIAYPDLSARAQVVAEMRRVISFATIHEASLVAQRQDDDTGLTAESLIERNLGSRYSVLAGLGVALLSRNDTTSGDGAIRLGFARILTADGWYARVEARIPTSIGLPRSRLNQSLFAAAVGQRASWSDLAQLRSVFTPLLSPELFGALEGTVILDEKGLPDIGILFNGRQVAATDRSGRYRASRLPVGPGVVSLEMRAMPPGIVPIGSFSQTVEIPPRASVQADFMLGRFVTLQSTLLVCRATQQVPLARARVALIGESFTRTYETDAQGGFRDDSIPPGQYEMLIDAATVSSLVSQDQIPRLHVDLAGDLLGYVVRLGCLNGGPAPVPTPGVVLRSISGAVVCDAAGAPRDLEAVVHLLGPTAAKSVLTAPTGEFMFAEVPPGSYLLMVDPDPPGGKAMRSTVVDVTAGDVGGLTLKVRCEPQTSALVPVHSSN